MAMWTTKKIIKVVAVGAVVIAAVALVMAEVTAATEDEGKGTISTYPNTK